MVGVSVYSSYPVYVLARVLQGLGPALTVPNALDIMGKCFFQGPRNMGFALFASSAPVGAMAGLLFGPLFAMAWWPWIYWSLALGVAFLFVLAIVAIPNKPVEGEQRQRRAIRETLDRVESPRRYKRCDSSGPFQLRLETESGHHVGRTLRIRMPDP